MVVQGSEVFSYEPLPDAHTHIRLLTVWPCEKFSDPLLCQLHVVKLADDLADLRDPQRGWKRRPATCPQYAALSYAWGMNDTGDSSWNRQVYTNGKRKSIGQNLFEGLLRIRHQRDTASPRSSTDLDEDNDRLTLVIWIDAACIDQENLVERTKQVSLMGCIFKFASHLIVWLGEGRSEQEDLAVLPGLRCIADHLTSRDAAADYATDGTSSYEHSRWHEHAVVHNDQANGEHTEGHVEKHGAILAMLQPLGAFISRRYFTRRWVLQEMYFGSLDAQWTTYWGPVQHTFSEDDSTVHSGFLAAYEFYHTAQESGTYNCADMLSKLRTALSLFDFRPCELEVQRSLVGTSPRVTTRPPCRYTGGTRFDFDDIGQLLVDLDMASPFDCIDPRDRLFSILSFRPQIGMIPDYTLSMVDAYTLLARKLIEHGYIGTVFLNLRPRINRSLQVVNMGQESEGRIDASDLPSWVPDFRETFTAYFPEGVSKAIINSRFQDDNTLVYPLRCLGLIEIAPTKDRPWAIIKSLREPCPSGRLLCKADSLRGAIFQESFCYSDTKAGDLLMLLPTRQSQSQRQDICMLRPRFDNSSHYRVINILDWSLDTGLVCVGKDTKKDIYRLDEMLCEIERRPHSDGVLWGQQYWSEPMEVQIR